MTNRGIHQTHFGDSGKGGAGVFGQLSGLFACNARRALDGMISVEVSCAAIKAIGRSLSITSELKKNILCR